MKNNTSNNYADYAFQCVCNAFNHIKNNKYVICFVGAYNSSYDGFYPDRVIFSRCGSISPYSGCNKSNKLYVYSVYKGLSVKDDIHNINLWDFYILDNNYINTLSQLLSMNIKPVSYNDLLSVGGSYE